MGIITDDVKRPGFGVDAAASEILGPCVLGDELSSVVFSHDDPSEEAKAEEQSRDHGVPLARDDDGARRLDGWRAMYREIVAGALRQA